MLPRVCRTNKGFGELIDREMDMDPRKKLVGAGVLALLFLSAPACAPNITEPDTDSDTTVCLWVDGVLECIETGD